MTIANLKNYRIKALLLLFSIAFTLQAQSQSSPESDPAPQPAVAAPAPEAQIKQLTNYVETGGDYLTLSDGFGSWSGGYSRGVYQQGKNIWNAEFNGQREFGDAGVYFAAGDTYNINPDWYAAFTVGSSAGGFFWPRFRTDGFLNKKWLVRKQWITTAGFTYVMSKDAHRDHTVYLGTTYYFEKPWIVEQGIYFNISHPGAVFAPAGFVAVTEGHNKQQYVTVRAGFGEEAYQLIGPAASLSQFNSETLTITWRKWVGPNWGFNFVGDYYHSPFYLRGGSSFGFFKEF